MRAKIRVIVARNTFSHMGKFAGYDRLFTTLEKDHRISIFSSRRINETFIKHYFNLALLIFFRWYYGNHYFTLIDWIGNMRIEKMAKKNHPNIIHFSYLENNYADPFKFFDNNEKVKLLGTIHQPAVWWRKNVKKMKALQKFHGLIVLSSLEQKFFEAILPGKVFFIRHGVETTFFCPDPSVKKDLRTCVFAGNWMRDIPLLIKIINSLNVTHPEIRFNIINPHVANKKHPLYSLVNRKNVFLHKNLPDEKLKEVYCSSAILLLPLIDSTVNNALMEGAACGLPVIASDVGGVRDYTSPLFCDYVSNASVQDFADRIVRLIENPAEISNRGNKAAEYMKQELNWKIIADKTAELYEQLSL